MKYIYNRWYETRFLSRFLDRGLLITNMLLKQRLLEYVWNLLSLICMAAMWNWLIDMEHLSHSWQKICSCLIALTRLWLFSKCLAILTRWVPLVEQELISFYRSFVVVFYWFTAFIQILVPSDYYFLCFDCTLVPSKYLIIIIQLISGDFLKIWFSHFSQSLCVH